MFHINADYAINLSFIDIPLSLSLAYINFLVYTIFLCILIHLIINI